MKIDCIEDPRFNSNTYIISNEITNDVIIIDPGDLEGSLTKDFLTRSSFFPEYILLTHEHIDHIGGINKIKDDYPKCKLLCSKGCSERIVNEVKNMSKYFAMNFRSYPADIFLDDIDNKLEWHNEEFRFYSTPGHSAVSSVISFKNKLFTGDTLIKDLQTVTKLPSGNRKELERSVDFIKNEFDPKTILMPGHGESFYLNDLIIF